MVITKHGRRHVGSLCSTLHAFMAITRNVNNPLVDRSAHIQSVSSNGGRIARLWLDMSRNSGWQLSADGAVNRGLHCIVKSSRPTLVLRHASPQPLRPKPSGLRSHVEWTLKIPCCWTLKGGGPPEGFWQFFYRKRWPMRKSYILINT